jgi:hypothetical protein
MSASQQRVSLFLDAGVIIQGCAANWGSAKGVLILAALRDRYVVVLADAVENEIAREREERQRTLSAERAAIFANALDGWFARVRLERLRPSTNEAVARALPTIMPALRHMNDLPAVVAAMESQPDWVISTNRAHWNEELATRSGLRIVTPQDFLLGLHPEA